MEYKIVTTIDAVGDAYCILDELGLVGLLTGKPTKIQAAELINALFKERKLVKMITTISNLSAADAGALDIEDAVQLVTDFFVSMSAKLRSLADMGLAAVVQDPK